MPTPALLTIQSGISQIRYATLKGIMAAKKKEIKEVTPSAEIVDRPSHQRIAKDLSAAENVSRRSCSAMAMRRLAPLSWRRSYTPKRACSNGELRGCGARA